MTALFLLGTNCLLIERSGSFYCCCWHHIVAHRFTKTCLFFSSFNFLCLLGSLAVVNYFTWVPAFDYGYKFSTNLRQVTMVLDGVCLAIVLIMCVLIPCWSLRFKSYWNSEDDRVQNVNTIVVKQSWEIDPSEISNKIQIGNGITQTSIIFHNASTHCSIFGNRIFWSCLQSIVERSRCSCQGSASCFATNFSFVPERN
jgi:hypothetical protein